MKHKHPTVAEVAECQERLRLIRRILRIEAGAGHPTVRTSDVQVYLTDPIEDLRIVAKKYVQYYKSRGGE